MTTTQEALKLNVMIGDYPNTVALKDAERWDMLPPYGRRYEPESV